MFIAEKYESYLSFIILLPSVFAILYFYDLGGIKFCKF